MSKPPNNDASPRDPNDCGDWQGELAQRVAAGETVEAVENRWGFTTKAMSHCLEVVGILRCEPEKFLQDPVLRATGLWRWIHRAPTVSKTQYNRVRKRLMVPELSKKRRLALAEDALKDASTGIQASRAVAERQLRAAFGDPVNEDAICTNPAESSSFDAEGAPVVLHRQRKCYVCGGYFSKLHHFYFALCSECGDFNFNKRLQTCDMTGKVVLLTGARIKIGYQIALRLLRDGAVVIATTRFPQDAGRRFREEKDFEKWCNRLHLQRLDLRDLEKLKLFCRYLLQSVTSLHAVIHNAAQTIARPEAYYQHLLEAERRAPETAIVEPACHQRRDEPLVEAGKPSLFHVSLPQSALSAEPEPGVDRRRHVMTAVFDDGAAAVDVVKPFHDMQDTLQVSLDKRSKNSWSATLAEVSAEEVAEVHAINALAPFIMNSMLKPLLVARQEGCDDNHFIINVSAMEGKFNRNKTTCHPHTNMAKAALNMMTHTSGPDYASDRIYMNSVDTGWVTDERPLEQRRNRQLDCPLDEVDGAARVLDLIYTNSTEHSQFWKDYRPTRW